jgi:putative ABC transport system permease protein
VTASPPLLRIAARSVRKNARHSAGTILAIAVGFLALVLMDGYLSYLERDLTDAIGERLLSRDVVVERPGAPDLRESARPFEEAQLGAPEQAFLDAWLAARPDVVARMRFVYVWGSASTGRASAPFYGLGYDVEAGRAVRGRYAWDVLAGRPLYRAGADAALLGGGLGTRLDCERMGRPPVFGRDGLPIEAERPFRCRRPRVQLIATTASGQLNAVDAEVAGIVDGGIAEFDSKWVNLPLPLAQRLLDTDTVAGYIARLADPAAAPAFARALEAAARARGLAISAYPWMEHPNAEEHRRGLKLLAVYRALVALVVVLVAAMSTLTTMAKAVSERTREIGTLRSLGFLRRHVVALFAVEAAILSLAGAVLGAIATLGITLAVNGAGISYQVGLATLPIPLAIRLRPGVYVAAALFLAALAAVAAVLPARAAARQAIPDALSHV